MNPWSLNDSNSRNENLLLSDFGNWRQMTFWEGQCLKMTFDALNIKHNDTRPDVFLEKFFARFSRTWLDAIKRPRPMPCERLFFNHLVSDASSPFIRSLKRRHISSPETESVTISNEATIFECAGHSHVCRVCLINIIHRISFAVTFSHSQTTGKSTSHASRNFTHNDGRRWNEKQLSSSSRILMNMFWLSLQLKIDVKL